MTENERLQLYDPERRQWKRWIIGTLAGVTIVLPMVGVYLAPSLFPAPPIWVPPPPPPPRNPKFPPAARTEATPDNALRIRQGMDQEEVRSILGLPDAAEGTSLDMWWRDEFSINVHYDRGIVLRAEVILSKDDQQKIEKK